MKTAWWLSTGIWPGRQDGNNLVTNKVTLAEFDDRFAAGGTAALSLSAVWACVNLIAGTGATLPLMVYRMRGDRRETATDHPLYRVLHDSPNAEQTAVDFWEGAFASLELKGNAVAEIDRAGDGRVLALTPLAWDDLNVSRREGGPLEYRRKGELIDAGRILHIGRRLVDAHTRPARVRSGPRGRSGGGCDIRQRRAPFRGVEVQGMAQA
jgi:hypothetical protein